MHEDSQALIKSVDNVDLATWSDDRRKEFSATFQSRLRAARFILIATAAQARQIALNQKFISEKHVNKLRETPHCESDAGNHSTYGGRSYSELSEVAEQRARDLLKDLPPIKNVIKIIQPDVAKMIDKKDELLKKGQKFVDRLNDLSEHKDLADYDQTLTIAEFRKQLKERAAERRRIVLELDELGKEGCELEKQINKSLYAGIPGLSDAVIKAISNVIDRAIALEQMGRRVHEKVMFGDSKEAMDILRTFEQDEVTVGDTARKEMLAALVKLGITAPKKLGSRKGK